MTTEPTKCRDRRTDRADDRWRRSWYWRTSRRTCLMKIQSHQRMTMESRATTPSSRQMGGRWRAHFMGRLDTQAPSMDRKQWTPFRGRLDIRVVVTDRRYHRRFRGYLDIRAVLMSRKGCSLSRERPVIKVALTIKRDLALFRELLAIKAVLMNKKRRVLFHYHLNIRAGLKLTWRSQTKLCDIHSDIKIFLFLFIGDVGFFYFHVKFRN